MKKLFLKKEIPTVPLEGSMKWEKKNDCTGRNKDVKKESNSSSTKQTRT